MRILKNSYPLFLLYILIFIIFFPILFLKKLFPGFDLLLVFYPYSHYFLNQQSFLASGILNGFNIATTPAGFAGNWIYYRFFNFGFLDFVSFYNVLIFFYFILTTIFSYLASRKLGFDKYVSVLVASVYIFSAYNLSWMVNIVTAASLFIFPAVIYFLLKFRNTQNWLWPALGGVVLGLGLITSHPQFALIGIFGGFLFSIFLIFSARGESVFGRESLQWKFLAAFLVICFMGFVLSAFQLLPEYQLGKLTQRGVALSFQDSQECALGAADFVRYLLPNFGFGVNCESLLHVGILPLIFAIFAVIYLKKDKGVIFWSLLLVFALLFSIKYSPFAWIFHQFPVWSGLRGPARFIMLGNFALAVLSGYGFNWILENEENFKEFKIFRWIKRIFLGFLFLIIMINVLGLFKKIFIGLAQDFFDKYYYSKTIGLPIEHYHRSIENLIFNNFYTFSFLNKEFLIPLLLIVMAFLVLFFIKKFNKTSLFYVFLLSGFIWAATSPMVSSGLNRDFFAETEVVNFLKKQTGNFRIYSLMPNLSAYQLVISAYSGAILADENEFLKMMLPPNLNLVYGLDSIDGYDVSMPRRVSRILAELLSERATLGNKIAEARLKPEEKIKVFESRANLLRMMNVKYIISAYALDEKNFKKVLEIKTTRFNVPVYVYEDKNVLPRFYFAKSVKPIKSDELKALDQILISDINYKDISFIECGNDCGNNSGGKIIDYEYKNGYLRLNTESQTGGWLIFSESFDKNWHAKMNDEKAPIYRANYTYQAIKVPAGKNTIEFIYKP
ncbi:MAG: YfhO family protein [Patescibacteria group bacterium]